jgi:hypothetical protein
MKIPLSHFALKLFRVFANQFNCQLTEEVMSKKIRNWFFGISSGLRAWYPRSYLNADQETWTRLLDLSMTKAKRLADFISLFTQLGLVNLAFQYWLAKHDASGRGLEQLHME